jgi:hypothetical protein
MSECLRPRNEKARINVMQLGTPSVERQVRLFEDPGSKRVCHTAHPPEPVPQPQCL